MPAREPAAGQSGVGVALVNFNTAGQTLRCLESLRTCTLAPDWVVVLDNASRMDDFERVAGEYTAFAQSALRVYRAAENLGAQARSERKLMALPQADPLAGFLAMKRERKFDE